MSAATVTDAAEALVAAGGFDALSVRRVADALGVSRQVVYTHFGGMDGLLDELHRRLSSRLTDAVRSVETPPGTTEHLRAAAANYRHVARRWPALYQLAFERPVADYVPGPIAADDLAASFEHIVAAARAWLANSASGAPPDRAAAIGLARALWSTMHGFVVLERVGFADEQATDGLSDRAVVALLAGWTTP